MRLSSFLLYLGPITACVSCGKLNQPLEGGSGINPLDLAGGSSFTSSTPSSGDADINGGLMAGDYVETSLPNTAFYASKPGPSTKPKGVLAQGVVLKVLTPEGNFIQVQAMTGEVGYVSNAAVVPQGMLTANVPLAPGAPPVVEPESPEDEPAPDPEIPGIQPPDEAPDVSPPDDTPAPEPEIPGIQE
ncbi:hypothetical protein SAMN02745181_1828 [Rubritalea squalenifaciens DSM 18772]|uniref:SH3 domain-containing protein n=2 Tax=Rubritalea squalenifaciens TaxID=407226 RepID=A0A1M6IIY7_9BACT|nr:hypothetical protein SAMN02745181_1828 [Rubritalea squalenifaciens DSM 18772]